ncbi:PIG-L family deacetylase [bacterium]|jgi:N-acetylglucosamine malate deacetylase 1|nr:PIG-L family deacetylase [bacterium]
MKKKVLVVAAHPDDEVLGCGGAILRHTDNGDEVSVIFLADGVTSRIGNNNLKVGARMQAAINACDILGTRHPQFFEFPDNRLDALPLLDIVKKLECAIDVIKPEVIYTHHSGDLNIDHKITHQAVITASRPQPECTVREIYSFEVLSSTEWSTPSSASFFIPNKFIDISLTLDRKLYALEAYNYEMHDFPHSRSIESVKVLAKYRGSSMGMMAAEAFKVERILNQGKYL